MEALANSILTEYKAKHPNAVLSVEKDKPERKNSNSSYIIYLNGAGDKSLMITLRKDSLGLMLAVCNDSMLNYMTPKDEAQVRLLLFAHMPP